MKKIQLEIKGMSYSQSQTNAYALILGEADGNRRLPIIIGAFEAHAIAIELGISQGCSPACALRWSSVNDEPVSSTGSSSALPASKYPSANLRRLSPLMALRTWALYPSVQK